jgi:hypothetical protein
MIFPIGGPMPGGQRSATNSHLTGIIFSVTRNHVNRIEKYSTNNKSYPGRKMEVEARKETVLVPVTPSGSVPVSE